MTSEVTLIIEDGSIVSGANSYITVTEWDTWATDRGIQHSHSDAKISHAILRAMDYFESLNFKGLKHTEDQPLQWPRDQVYVDGYSVDSDEIPKEVRGAMYELTKIELDGDSPLNPQDRQTSSEKIGDIQVVYKNTAMMRKRTPAFNVAVAKLITSPTFVSRT